MKLKVRKLGDVTIIDTCGNILMLDDEQFRTVLLNVLKEGCINLIVNFAVTEYLCSTSLGTLALIIKRVRERGGDLKLANLNSKVMRFFEITRLVNMIDVYDSVEAAMKSFTAEAKDEEE
ncbi:MAG: STAS domain-containing protein [bacterium]|jgi:anti-sigma B factor antagonist|nr:STAS domain-containing protein [bacterium]